MEEISTSFCFICLLHLANEQGLKIEDTAKVQEAEEEDEDGRPASKKKGADVHIMTTKVQVSEDTKKVRSILGSKCPRQKHCLC